MVVNYLKKLKVKDIEIMIVFYLDVDNIGGLLEVMNNIKVKSFYVLKFINIIVVYKNFVNMVKKKKLIIKIVKVGVKFFVKGVNV